jgi:hypothetical protein
MSIATSRFLPIHNHLIRHGHPLIPTQVLPAMWSASAIAAASEQSKTAQSAAGKEHHKGIEPRAKHKPSCGNRDSDTLPPGVGHTRHHGAARDDEPYSYGDEADAHDTCGSEPIPQTISDEVYRAGRAQRRNGARNGSGNSSHLPSDKTHIRIIFGQGMACARAKNWRIPGPSSTGPMLRWLASASLSLSSSLRVYYAKERSSRSSPPTHT